MVVVDDHAHTVSRLAPEALASYDTLGVGPGLGTAEITVTALRQLLPVARGAEPGPGTRRGRA